MMRIEKFRTLIDIRYARTWRSQKTVQSDTVVQGRGAMQCEGWTTILGDIRDKHWTQAASCTLNTTLPHS